MSNKTLSEQANDAAIASVKADKPSAFTVGGHYDSETGKVMGGITYDRTWKTGWGATAYLRGWYYDQPVIAQKRGGVVIGGEGSYKF